MVTDPLVNILVNIQPPAVGHYVAPSIDLLLHSALVLPLITIDYPNHATFLGGAPPPFSYLSICTLTPATLPCVEVLFYTPVSDYVPCFGPPLVPILSPLP